MTIYDHYDDFDQARHAREAMMARAAARCASPSPPTIASLYLELRLMIADFNETSMSAGVVGVTIAMPSLRTFLRRVRRPDAYEVLAARYDRNAAKRRFRLPRGRAGDATR